MTEREQPPSTDRVPRRRVRYELWDTDSGNLIGAYTSEAQALAVVRGEVTTHGAGHVQAWALGRMGGREPQPPVLEGTALLDRANMARRGRNTPGRLL